MRYLIVAGVSMWRLFRNKCLDYAKYSSAPDFLIDCLRGGIWESRIQSGNECEESSWVPDYDSYNIQLWWGCQCEDREWVMWRQPLCRGKDETLQSKLIPSKNLIYLVYITHIILRCVNSEQCATNVPKVQICQQISFVLRTWPNALANQSVQFIHLQIFLNNYRDT